MDAVAAGEAVEAGLDALLERRARQIPEGRAGQEHANGLAAMWRASERLHARQVREENRWAWVRHLDGLARFHRARAEEGEAK